MKFDITLPCFYGHLSFAEAIRRSKSHGFMNVETWSWEALDLKESKKILDAEGVSLISVCGCDFHMNEADKRDQYIEGIKRTIEACKYLGVKQFITQAGDDTGAPREIQHDNVIAALMKAAPLMEEAGITLLLEPLNFYVEHKGTYLGSSREAFSMVRTVGSPNVKVLFDMYHQQINEGNIIPNVTENLDVIGHLHCAGHPGRHELQFGENDYKNIFAAVEKAGYRGFVGLEYMPSMDPDDSLREFKRIYIN